MKSPTSRNTKKRWTCSNDKGKQGVSHETPCPTIYLKIKSTNILNIS